MSRALLHGADDYVVIDDGAEQLLDRAIARISTKVRRPRRQALRLGPYTLDSAASALVSPEGEVRLAPRELLLARVLIESHSKVVAIEQLCRTVCGRVDDAAKYAIKQHAYVFRKKCVLAAGAHLPKLRVQAVYGKGYRLTL
jgi:DNA-binding response OmpR family regulator